MPKSIVIKPKELEGEGNPTIEFTGSLGGTARIEVSPTGDIEVSNGSSSSVFRFLNPTVFGSGSMGSDTFLLVSTGSANRSVSVFSGGVMISGSLDVANHWASYTPTVTSTPVNLSLPTTRYLHGKYCRLGKKLTLMFNLSYDSTSGGSSGYGAYRISMPGEFTIDTQVAPTGSTSLKWLDGISIGTGLITGNTTLGGVPVAVIPFTTGSMILVGMPNATTSGTPATWGGPGGSEDTMFPIAGQSEFRASFTAEVPIL
jgi:hypothetical protein